MGDFLTQQPVKTLTTQDLTIGGLYDSTGTNALGIDGSGRITVNQGAPGTAANSWFIEVTDGTNVLFTSTHPGFIQGTVSATNPSVGLTGTTAPTSATEIGGVYNTSLPTYTNGQLGQFQIDSSGRMLVGSIANALPAGSNNIGSVNQGTSPWVDNLTQVGGSAIALGQTTMSASLPVTIASNQTALPVSQSGTWTVATNADNTPGSATSAKGLIVGGSDGTDFRFLKVAADGTLYVNDQTSPGTPVTSGALTHAALAPGASITISTSDITTGKTGYLKTAVASASGPIKAVLNTVSGGTPTAKSTKFDSASWPTLEWWYQNDEIQQAGGTNNHWSVTITNEDNKNTFDVYADFSWIEL